MIKAFAQFLGVGTEEAASQEKSASQASEMESVRHIIAKMEALDADEAHFIALFASILSRVARADLQVSEAERTAIEEIVMKLGHLDEATAALVAEIAKNQNQLLGGVENYLITRAFKDRANAEQKFELMESLFAVAAAEEGISAEENQEILKIAEEIGLSRQDFLAVRAAFKEHLNVLTGIPKT